MSAIAKIAKNRHIFSCQNCDYNTCNKYDFEKHVQTIKHKKLHLSIESGDFSIKNSEKSPLKIFTCEKCNKNYKDNSGLWRNSKICTINIKLIKFCSIIYNLIIIQNEVYSGFTL
jgi:hypothetical protein